MWTVKLFFFCQPCHKREKLRSPVEYSGKIISTMSHIPTASSWFTAVHPLKWGSFLPYPEMIIFVLKDSSAGHFCQIAWPVTPCLVHFNNNNSNKTLQDVLSSLSGRISSSAKICPAAGSRSEGLKGTWKEQPHGEPWLPEWALRIAFPSVLTQSSTDCCPECRIGLFCCWRNLLWGVF